MSQLSFLLFGDQSLDTYGFLAGFFRQTDRGLLASGFLDQAGAALRREIESLPRAERAQLPVFQTLAQLNERYHAAAFKHAGVDGALLCISQIAHYLQHADASWRDIVAHEHTFLVGLCSGMFAAAAVASTPTVTALVPVATQAVLMAFRTGRHVAQLAAQLEPDTKGGQSWTHLYAGQTEEGATAALAAFHAERAVPAAAVAYVSAVSANSVAVSGPPSTLAALDAAGVLGRPATLPVHGPYHAAHLHGATDVRAVLGLDTDAVRDALFATAPRSAVMSCARGQWLRASATDELFALAAREVLAERLCLGHVLGGCVELAQAFGGAHAVVVPLGPTQTAATLTSVLRAQTQLDVVQRPAPTFLAASTVAGGAPVGNHGRTGRAKLAIVGMAGRFPDAATHEAFWTLLASGLDVHRVVPADRFPAATHVDPTGKAVNTSHTPYGCWIENPGHFDPRFFNMSPREALQTDPMQRMAIATAYEALEMAGYVPNRTPSTRLDRIGTFYGQTSDDWREINAAQAVDTYYITGGVRAFGPGRINYHFGFSGPSLSVDTACSSSAAALNVACASLWARDCDTAVVGGLSCMTNSDIFAGLSRGQFLSKRGPCQTFDNDADGYCRGDGCASVIVKRLEDAEADGDRVLAVILGTATNHSADAVSITHPHGPTQSLLSAAILDDAGVDPLDVDYVEMHGTGTQAGDGTEMVSVTDVFAPAHRPRPADRPLFLGSAKANVGHGEAASGVTALVKVLLMLQKNAIPPHVGIKGEINKSFPSDLGARNVNIAFHLTPFQRADGRPRRVFVNNFSAAGGNTGLLLEDAPVRPAPVADPRAVHVVTATAKSKSALRNNATNLAAWLAAHPDTPLAHVAYTTTARRIQHPWRISVAATDVAGAQAALVRAAADIDALRPVGAAPKVVLLFTGQGAHYAGLGRDFYARHPVFRTAIDEYATLAAVHGFPDFMPLVDGSEPDVARLGPVAVQLGVVAVEMALARLWRSWGITPTAVVGHSLGEYAALAVAGVVTASDALFLVGTRAQLLVDTCTAGTHAMLAVQGSVDVVQAALGTTVNVACRNGPLETVVSGEAALMADAAATLAAAGLKCTTLAVPFAFHSAQVDPILAPFATRAQSVTFRAPAVAVASTLLGTLVAAGTEGVFDAAYLARHARDAVDFVGAIASAQAAGTVDETTVWLEVGPHPVCANLVKAALGASTVAVPTLRRGEATDKTMAATLCALHAAGVSVDWPELHHDFGDSTRLLDLPTYAYDYKNYWLQYEGDWSLIKNRFAQMLPAPAAAPAPTSKLSTTSVQRVTREDVDGSTVTLETESDLCRADLRRAVEGHLVNNTPLCPSTLYADMAMTIGDYVHRLVRPDEAVHCNVADVEVGKTLILDDAAASQVLRVSTVAHIDQGFARLSFSTGEGRQRTEHATCRVVFGDADAWRAEFERVNYLIRARIDALHDAERRGQASKVSRGIAYKLFTALVDYAPRYRGMDEVVLDSATCEATASVRFQTTAEDGHFHFNPYWIDSMCHVSGFVVNATDAVDSRDQVYISHGWGSLRFLETPDATKTYTNYIRMQPVKGTTMYSGDAYVFDGDRIIGVCGDVRFAAIPRKVLNLVLPPRGVASGPAPASATKPVAKAAPASAPAPKKKTKALTHANMATVNQKLVSVVGQVLDILAAEVGVARDELADAVAFADLGVDSLMSLTVSGRIREELDIDLASNAFVDHPTVGAFRTYLQQFDKAAPVDDSSSSASDSDASKSDSAVTTPMADSDAGSVHGDAGDASDDLSALQAAVRNTIAQEMQVDVEDIIAAPDLADLGMDSLMSLQILGTLRETTGLDIANDLFVANPTLKDVERALGIEAKPAVRAPVSAPAPAPAPVASSSVVRLEPADPIPKMPRPAVYVDHYPHRTAKSVLLQGSPRTASRNLFMVPDGSGSATSYTEIAEIGRDWAVWGLFSPFMKTPEEYKCGVYGIATKFITEIKRRQPDGPYSIAGWSAGGVICYEIIQQLTRAGDVVEHCVFIDAPCPVTIEPLPKGLHAWFASIGLLGEGGDQAKVPAWLLPHFAASVTALSNYCAEPVPADKCPKITLIWCEDGVCHLPTDPRPTPYPEGHALFLLDNRSDFGPNRWDEFLDPKKLYIRHMPGNHFSMMHGDYARQLGAIIRDGLSR